MTVDMPNYRCPNCRVSLVHGACPECNWILAGTDEPEPKGPAGPAPEVVAVQQRTGSVYPEADKILEQHPEWYQQPGEDRGAYLARRKGLWQGLWKGAIKRMPA